MQQYFQAGDIVEVRLVEKSNFLFYSKNLKEISEFKEKLAKEIFFSLREFDIKPVFMVGSFLTKKVDYNDIDLIIVSDNENEEKIYNFLTEKFNLKFHILVIKKDNFSKLLEICPLTRSMLFYYISNKEFKSMPKRVWDKKHINFLLMMPKDLLEVKAESRVFYDSIRRLLVIDYFLREKDEDACKIDVDIEKIIGKSLFEIIRRNGAITDKEILSLRKIIKQKLNLIQAKL
jgi:hypothetical protein